MKYTIEGFSQTRLVEYGFDATDAVILRWVVDFYNTGKMKKVMFEDGLYFWINYTTVIAELPIIRIKKQALRDRFNYYCEQGLMDKQIERAGGSYTYFKFDEQMLDMFLSDSWNVGGVYSTTRGVGSELHTGVGSELHTKDSSTSLDSSRRDKEKSALPRSRPRSEYRDSKPQEREYATHVLMTPDAYSQLCEQYGERDVKKKCEAISDYMAANRKRYADFPAAIRNWFRRDGVEPRRTKAAEIAAIDANIKRLEAEIAAKNARPA